MIWRCGDFEFDARVPVVMGIINVTPDSFSDGGSYADDAAAVDAAMRMVDEGASIIDVGGESTRPGATAVPEDEELSRVIGVVRELASRGVCVSIDTRHAPVARACVDAGASIINDVSGFSDPAMVEVAAESGVGVVVMHMKGDPATMQDDPTYDDVVVEVRDFLAARAAELEAAGIAHDRICIDPGPGFGKTPKQTIELVRNLHELRHVGYPVMAALSRKSYIGYAYKIDDPAARDQVSAAEALMACELGASIVRTHNVALTVDALKDLRPYVIIGLGANLPLVAEPGEERDAKIAQINHAVGGLCVLPDSQIVDMSSFYESEPAYYEDQDTFVNAAVLMRSGLPPKELLKYLHTIENQLGRVREIENGPRTIDVDIVDYQMYDFSTDELTLPHPRACERDFVVKPLLEILPGHVLADGTPVGKVPEGRRVGRATRI